MKKIATISILVSLLVLGLLLGYFLGNKRGNNLGYTSGYKLGIENGKKNGYENGYDSGYYVGLSKGKEEAIITQMNRSSNEIRADLITREIQSIKDYVTATSEIIAKDEGTFLTVKIVKYLTGKISNSATLVTAKDIMIKVTYFSKTGTEISTQEIKKYDFVKPGQTITYRERAIIPEQTDSYKFKITDVSALQ